MSPSPQSAHSPHATFPSKKAILKNSVEDKENQKKKEGDRRRRREPKPVQENTKAKKHPAGCLCTGSRRSRSNEVDENRERKKRTKCPQQIKKGERGG